MLTLLPNNVGKKSVNSGPTIESRKYGRSLSQYRILSNSGIWIPTLLITFDKWKTLVFIFIKIIFFRSNQENPETSSVPRQSTSCWRRDRIFRRQRWRHTHDVTASLKRHSRRRHRQFLHFGVESRRKIGLFDRWFWPAHAWWWSGSGSCSKSWPKTWKQETTRI